MEFVSLGAGEMEVLCFPPFVLVDLVGPDTADPFPFNIAPCLSTWTVPLGWSGVVASPSLLGSNAEDFWEDGLVGLVWSVLGEGVGLCPGEADWQVASGSLSFFSLSDGLPDFISVLWIRLGRTCLAGRAAGLAGAEAGLGVVGDEAADGGGRDEEEEGGSGEEEGVCLDWEVSGSSDGLCAPSASSGAGLGF